MITSKKYILFEQITSIILIISAFFITGIASPINDIWDERFGTFICVGAVVFPLAGFTLLLVSVWHQKKSERNIASRNEWIAIGCMFVIQYLIRVTMVGTTQVDEGLTCYRSLQELVYHPEMILDDFVSAGRLADRKAYGYIFFALMGEFLVPGNGVGFQWSQLFLGVAASCCLYRTFRIMFPKVRLIVSFLAAFVISVQPMFLGLSTLCGLEFGMTVFFIFSFYSCVSKKYLLMAFWLIMLGTTKSSGLILALAFLGLFVVSNMINNYLCKKKEPVEKDNTASDDEGDVYDWKTGAVSIAAMAAVSTFVYFVVRVCSINGIAFSEDYVKVKFAQLLGLNFNWVWYIVIFIGIFMIAANKRVRKTNVIGVVNASVLIGCFVVYIMYLVAYPKALLVRYNMLADLLLTVLGTVTLLKLFERRRAIISALGFVGMLMFAQTFITVDPVSTLIFQNVNTNSFPMVYAAKLSTAEPVFNGEPGDFGYYNYQYTFVDKAINEIISQCGVQDEIVIASSANNCEVQFVSEDLCWNDKLGARRFTSRFDGYENSNLYGTVPIKRYAVDGLVKMTTLPEHVIYIESPINHGDSKRALEILDEYYYHNGPQAVDMGYMGRVLFFNFVLKTSVDQ